MGMLVHQRVFAASDDAAAAAQIDGPTGGVACEPGIVSLWILQAHLTGRSCEDVVSGEMEPVAYINEGQRMVVPLDDELRDELAAVRGRKGRRAVQFWAGTEEVQADRLTPRHVRWTLFELHLEARAAVKAGSHLYLWVDVDPIALFTYRYSFEAPPATSTQPRSHRFARVRAARGSPRRR